MTEPEDFGSVCSGIEAASVAWDPLGWRPAWFAEIEAFPAAVLRHHYPQVPNLGDMTAIAARILCGDVHAPSILCGGTPCQAFSVAGLRNSLEDQRGNLTLKFVELANAIDFSRSRAGKPPAAVFWENVPGVLNTADNAFGCFLAGLAGENGALEPPEPRPAAGKSSKFWKWNKSTGQHSASWSHAGAVFGPTRAVAWRTMDAQYFGVAQRRRRVFVVASARKGFNPASVLFEWDSMRRDSAPSREPGQSFTHDVAPCLVSSGRGVERTGDTRGQDPVIACFGGNKRSGPIDVAPAMLGHAGGGGYKNDFETEAMVVHGTHAPAIAYTTKMHNTGSNNAGKLFAERTPCLDANSPAPALLTASQVRRLMPVECERLQGFPDYYTRIPDWDGWRAMDAEETPEGCEAQGLETRQNPKTGKWRVKDVDGPRYKALGNSWAVPNVRWIGRRLQAELNRLEALEARR